MVKLLKNAGEEVWSGKRMSYRGAQTQQIVQWLEEILESIRFGSGEAICDGFRECPI